MKTANLLNLLGTAEKIALFLMAVGLAVGVTWALSNRGASGYYKHPATTRFFDAAVAGQTIYATAGGTEEDQCIFEPGQVLKIDPYVPTRIVLPIPKGPRFCQFELIQMQVQDLKQKDLAQLNVVPSEYKQGESRDPLNNLTDNLGNSLDSHHREELTVLLPPGTYKLGMELADIPSFVRLVVGN